MGDSPSSFDSVRAQSSGSTPELSQSSPTLWISSAAQARRMSQSIPRDARPRRPHRSPEVLTVVSHGIFPGFQSSSSETSSDTSSVSNNTHLPTALRYRYAGDIPCGGSLIELRDVPSATLLDGIVWLFAGNQKKASLFSMKPGEWVWMSVTSELPRAPCSPFRRCRLPRPTCESSPLIQPQRQRPLPSRRCGSSCNAFNDQLIVFGGGRHGRVSNEVWSYSPLVNSWHLMESCPLARQFHSSQVWRGYLVVFGGLDSLGIATNDVGILSLATGVWSMVGPPGPGVSPLAPVSNISWPVGRWGHLSTIMEDQLFVFGGAGQEAQTFDDLWALDLMEMRWAQINPLPETFRPRPRVNHAGVRLGHRWVIHGGECGAGGLVLNDLWEFDLKRREWCSNVTHLHGCTLDGSLSQPSHLQALPGRFGHSAVVFCSKSVKSIPPPATILFIGGFNSSRVEEAVVQAVLACPEFSIDEDSFPDDGCVVVGVDEAWTFHVDLWVSERENEVLRRCNTDLQEALYLLSEESSENKFGQVDKTGSSHDDRLRCKICFDAEVSAVFLPCGHVLCCLTCANQIIHNWVVGKCPLCRQLVRQAVRIRLT